MEPAGICSVAAECVGHRVMEHEQVDIGDTVKGLHINLSVYIISVLMSL